MSVKLRGPEQLDEVAERLRLIATEPVFELVADRR
jgi:hypothetical protein